MNNRDYFEGLKDSHITERPAVTLLVGLEGEIVQCVPTWEIAYASNSRNIDTVSIECCHPDETGIFNKKTYQSMVDLCAWLCLKFDLDENDVIRHYDVTGKICLNILWKMRMRGESSKVYRNKIEKIRGISINLLTFITD